MPSHFSSPRGNPVGVSLFRLLIIMVQGKSYPMGFLTLWKAFITRTISSFTLQFSSSTLRKMAIAFDTQPHQEI